MVFLERYISLPHVHVYEVTNYNLQDYGIDWDGPISMDNDAEQVTVPDLCCPLTEEQYAHLQGTIAPLDNSHNYGIDLYTAVMELVEDMRNTH